MKKNYYRIAGFHYIMRGGEWYVLIEKKWHKCAPPTQRYPLLINDDIQKETTRPEADLEGSPGGAA
jgi:hypothetical protein